MDALRAAALDSLVKEILPKLTLKLNALTKLDPATRSKDQDLQFLVREAQELLTLLAVWDEDAADSRRSPVESPESPDYDMGEVRAEDPTELSNDDAMALLAMEGTDDIANVGISGGKSVAESLADDRGDEPVGDVPAVDANTEMSDDEAMMLLADMDSSAAPAPATAPKPA